MPWKPLKIPRSPLPVFPQSHSPRWLTFLFTAGLAAALLGCQRETAEEPGEFAYVRGENVEFRNELGPASEVISHLKTGERVRILSRRPRWAWVQTAAGETGWVLQRYLVGQEIYDQFAALAREAKVLPSQGGAQIRRQANLHLEPGRETQVFYQLAEGDRVEIVGHRVAPRNPEATASQAEGAALAYDDWLLVRAANGRSGWLLEGAVDMNPPLEVAQYREGLRIRAWFEIYREEDRGEEHAWYLWATIRRVAGLPYEFDEIRVFVWNPRASRYETSYRERNLKGFYPITVGSREAPGGTSPTFRLQLEDSAGQRFEKSYFMVSRQVRVER